MRAPCMGCKERTAEPNCHITCGIYQDYCVHQAEERRQRLLDHEITGYTNANVIKSKQWQSVRNAQFERNSRKGGGR